jgi:hypothetical protein
VLTPPGILILSGLCLWAAVALCLPGVRRLPARMKILFASLSFAALGGAILAGPGRTTQPPASTVTLTLLAPADWSDAGRAGAFSPAFLPLEPEPQAVRYPDGDLARIGAPHGCSRGALAGRMDERSAVPIRCERSS